MLHIGALAADPYTRRLDCSRCFSSYCPVSSPSWRASQRSNRAFRLSSGFKTQTPADGAVGTL